MKNCKQAWLRAFVTIGYNFGFRKGELKGIKVSQVDMKARTIRLLPGTTKNDEGRTIVMTDDVYDAVMPCLKDKSSDDPLFTWPDGRPVKDFRGSWKALTTAAKVKVRIHDFRRSAVRNMMDAGINRDVAKKISGHKTDSVFSRYNIVDANDLADAAQKLQARKRV